MPPKSTKEYCTEGGSDGPTLDYSGQWYASARALEHDTGRLRLLDFPAGHCSVQNARVQQSKDGTEAWVRLSLAGTDFFGAVEARYDPSTGTWIGCFDYTHHGCPNKTEGTAELSIAQPDGTGTLTTRVPEGGVGGPFAMPSPLPPQEMVTVVKIVRN